jgi:hypothetical protein
MKEGNKIVCDYCKKQVPEQADFWPTWFGSYTSTNGRDNLTSVICIDCFRKNKDKWREGKI